MANSLRHLVSQNKIRFTEDGFDLDLTYVTPRIIAMGYPASKTEGLYRNHIDEVERFFKTRHTGKYRVYNLCRERKYPADRFEGCARRYPFDDHNACPIELMYAFCNDAIEFLASDPANVCAVHCKAGKGRTGMMVAALLVHAALADSPAAALEHFAAKRTDDGKGVSIPSQRRYVSYYAGMLQSPRPAPPVARRALKSLTLVTAPSFDLGGGCDPYAIVADGRSMQQIFRSAVMPHVRGKEVVEIDLGGTVVDGDVKITLMDKDMTTDDTMCWFWCSPLLEGDSCELVQNDCDNAVKDKKHRHFDPDFRVIVHFGPLVEGAHGEQARHPLDDAPEDDIAADSPFEASSDAE